MSIRGKIRNIFPESILNNLLLTFPSLYKTKLINYESNLALDKKIDKILEQLDKVIEIDGNIIECGSARCGTSVIMANFLRKKGIKKKIYACDSFQGFDKTEHQSDITTSSLDFFTKISFDYITKKINKLGFSDIIIPIKGFFEETLPKLQSKFCFSLIDCDLEKSMIFSSEYVWKNLLKNGIIIFDDYTDGEFQGAKKGIDFFVKKYASEIIEHGLEKGLYIVKKG